MSAGRFALVALCLLSFKAVCFAADPPPLQILMVGDHGHHRPDALAKVITPVLAKDGIVVTCTDDVHALNAENLAKYDGLLFYLNTTELPAAEETALMDFVEGGKGVFALHCASAAFGNSQKYLDLVGGRFSHHQTGVFRTSIIDAQHPAMRGLTSFESWDETYVHDHLASDIRVLMVRPHDGMYEPWTWTRTQGKGRVFYTASGHDERTWNVPGFQKLLENGLLWSAGRLNDEAPPIPSEPVELPRDVKVGGAKFDIPGPLAPEDSMKHMHLPAGFHVELVAAEPDIVKPVSMAFDERGRLWVVETVDYPHTILPVGQPGHDRIVICEDSHHTGKLDKFTVFADGLNLPQGIAFARGGVVIPMSPQILFLKDNQGSGVADERRVLYDGFGRRDTHAMHGNFQYGLDNWMWASCGYSGLNVNVNGNDIHSAQCIFRFRVEKPGFEVITSTSNNTWGLGFNESGETFYSTANNSHSDFIGIPNRYFEQVPGWSGSGNMEIEDHKKAHPATTEVRQVDWIGGYTAACGHTFYTARAFPPEYWDKVSFVCEPTDHVIHADLVNPEGSGFVSHDGYDIMASDDSRVSPIQSVVGPDGSLYFIDWYSYVVQHNPVPSGFHVGVGGAYVTPLRDKTHGRIYRIVCDAPGAKPSVQPNLVNATAAALVETLKSDNMFWRGTAQRLLVERQNKDVAPALEALAATTTLDGTGNNPPAIHALWTLHGLGLLDGTDAAATAVATAALKNPAAGVREAALGVLPRNAAAVSAILDAKVLADPDLHVRRIALLALADMPADEAAGAAIWETARAEQNAKDHWLPLAATAAAARHTAGFLKAVAASKGAGSPEAASVQPKNLLVNGGFEQISGAAPEHWSDTTYGGKAEFAVDDGRSGHGVRITSSDGADASWHTTVAVQPDHQYILRGWIKTKGVATLGGRGALLNVHELQSPRALTKAITGNHDWTPVEVSFNSANLSEITINCLLGGWGNAKGTAWYDDITVTEVSGSGTPAAMAVRTVASSYAHDAPASVGAVLTSLRGTDGALASSVIDGLAAGWPADKRPADAQLGAIINDLLPTLPPAGREGLGLLAGKWGVQSAELSKAQAQAQQQMLAQLIDAKLPDSDRADAAATLIATSDSAENAAAIAKQLQPQTPPALAAAFIKALGDSSQDSAATALTTRWRFMAPSARHEAVQMLLRRPQWTRALLDAMEKDTVTKSDLSKPQEQQLATNADPKIARRAKTLLAKQGELPNPDREKLVKQFMPITEKSGDVAAGAQVFTKNCAVCHTFNGSGGKVGPELTGVFKGNKVDILTKILDPNRSVQGEYRLWVVQTKKGDSYSGRLASETKNGFEMLDTAGQSHTILREDVEKMAMQNIGVMPEGFESLGADQLTNVIAYVSQPKEKLAHP